MKDATFAVSLAALSFMLTIIWGGRSFVCCAISKLAKLSVWKNRANT